MYRNYTSTNADALSKDIQGNNRNSKIADILSPPRDLETLPLRERERDEMYEGTSEHIYSWWVVEKGI